MLEERINQLAEDVRVLKEVLADKLKERQDKIDEMKKEAEQKAHEAEAGVESEPPTGRGRSRAATG